MAESVAKAVIVTDNAELPLASDDKKLDILPPGHDETNISPNATEGVGLIMSTNKNVSAGNTKNCDIYPITVGRGFLTTSLKSSNLMDRATPNMIIARAILRNNKLPWLKLSRI